MGSFQDLKELLKKVIECEDKFTGFYDTALIVVEDAHCRETITVLREKHIDNLRILQDIDIEKYGNDEWIRCIPDLKISELLSQEKITGNSEIDDIAQIILNFEQQMKTFYTTVSAEIITRDEKELFDSLVMFKEKQIYEIIRCLEKW